MSEIAGIYSGEIYPEGDGDGPAHTELFKLDGRSGSGKLTGIYLREPEKIPEMPPNHAKLIVGYLSPRPKLTAEESDLLEKAREKLATKLGKVRELLSSVFSRKSNRQN